MFIKMRQTHIKKHKERHNTHSEQTENMKHRTTNNTKWAIKPRYFN